MAGGVDPVEAAGEHGHRGTGVGDGGCPVRCPIDAVGAAGKDHAALRRQFGGELGRHLAAIRGCGAGSDDGDSTQEGRREAARVALEPEGDRRARAELLKFAGPVDVLGGQQL